MKKKRKLIETANFYLVQVYPLPLFLKIIFNYTEVTI